MAQLTFGQCIHWSFEGHDFRARPEGRVNLPEDEKTNTERTRLPCLFPAPVFDDTPRDPEDVFTMHCLPFNHRNNLVLQSDRPSYPSLRSLGPVKGHLGTPKRSL